MIDLSGVLRKFLVTKPAMADLSSFANSRALFTRRPAPEGAVYPMAFISPLLDVDTSQSEISAEVPDLRYMLSVYGLNETSEQYRKVEEIAFASVALLNRMDPSLMEMPDGAQLVRVRALGPVIAPVDDDKLVGRAVNLRLLVKQG